MAARPEVSVRSAVIPGLDGLRAVAVLLVILFHQRVVGFGWVGVQVFFVLSGFLISGILVRQRVLPIGEYLRCFYGRRILRIFPVYYAYLAGLVAACVLFGTAPASTLNQVPYAATYTYDFFHASSAYVHSQLLTHFWSLAVEEQFYLVWPLVLYAIPRRHLPAVLAGLVVAGPLVRLATMAVVAGSAVDPWRTVYVLPTSHLDAFALGGLLAVAPVRVRWWHVAGTLALTVAVGLAGASFYALYLADGLQWVWGYSLVNLASAATVGAIRDRARIMRPLEHRLLAYVGMISYGVYVFHYPVQAAVERAIPTAPLTVRMAAQLGCVLVVAALSFQLFEKRITGLKDRLFPYRTAPDSPAPTWQPSAQATT